MDLLDFKNALFVNDQYTRTRFVLKYVYRLGALDMADVLQ